MECNKCKSNDFFEIYETGVNKYIANKGALTEIIYNTNICKACGNLQVDTEKIVTKSEYQGLFADHSREGL